MSGRLRHKIWSAVNTKTREGLIPSSSRLPWQVGYKIADRYEIHKILGGEGKRGIGIVYICYDHELRETIALKTLPDQFLDSENKKGIFNREVHPWTQFEKHPYIVRAQWVKLIEGRLFIGMEYVAPDQAGRNTLQDYLGQLSYAQILKVGIEICLGMEYAYGEGIAAHRDIRPENIMMTMDKRAKITDFGLVKALQEIGPQGQSGLRAGGDGRLTLFRNKGINICGTPTHMAPEQFDGYADRRSDIYAFGIVLYQMVNDGMLPFMGGEWEKLHRYKKPERIPSPVFPAIEKCLAKKPEERYKDFKEIRETLEAIYWAEIGQKFAFPKKEELDIGEWLNRGFGLKELGRSQDVIKSYDEALKVNPNAEKAQIGKGVILYTLGQYQEALACIEEALRVDPDFIYAQELKSKILQIVTDKTILGTPLVLAAEQGDLNQVEFLLSQGINVECYGFGALRAASENGHVEIVKLLLEEGVKGNMSFPSLKWAKKNGVVKYLVALYQLLGIMVSSGLPVKTPAENLAKKYNIGIVIIIAAILFACIKIPEFKEGAREPQQTRSKFLTKRKDQQFQERKHKDKMGDMEKAMIQTRQAQKQDWQRRQTSEKIFNEAEALEQRRRHLIADLQHR